VPTSSYEVNKTFIIAITPGPTTRRVQAVYESIDGLLEYDVLHGIV